MVFIGIQSSSLWDFEDLEISERKPIAPQPLTAPPTYEARHCYGGAFDW